MKRIFLFVILAVIVSGSYFLKQTVYAQPVPVPEGARQQVLAATIQIKMKTPLLDEAGQPVIAESNGSWHVMDEMAHGLGTLTRIEDQVFVVTHDHWGALLNTAITIEFQNAQGQLLAEISGDAFRSLVIYQDQGTMLFKAPPELKPAFRSAVSGNSQLLPVNSQVLLTRHQPGSEMVEVVPAQVTGLRHTQGIPSYQLKNLDGSPVVEGDSGGGIWFGGQLVGNLWRNVALETVQLAAGEEVASEQNITANSIAATYPDLTQLIRPEELAGADLMLGSREPVSP